MGFLHRGIAQLVEQRSPKPRAEGSNPSTPAKKSDGFAMKPSGFFVEMNRTMRYNQFNKSEVEEEIVCGFGGSF